jgi:hypothetical protein
VVYLFRRVAFALLRTLVERKDLRGLVLALDIDETMGEAEKRLESVNASDEERGIINTATAEQGFYFPASSFNGSNMNETILQTILPLLRNVNKVYLGVNRQWRFNTLVDGMKISMPQLQHLELELPFDFRMDRCNAEHTFCRHTAPASPAEQILIDATASSVETLSCTAGGLSSFPHLPRLKTLQIDVRGSWPGKLPMLMANSPLLKRVAYLSTSEHAPSPRELVEAMVSQRSTLEALRIDIENLISSDESFGYHGWIPTSNNWAIDSLAAFTQLRQLTIEAPAIWPYTRTGFYGDPHVTSSLEKLGSFLPECLEALFIQCGKRIALPLESLAMAAYEGRFTRLRRVMWNEFGGIDFMDLDRKTLGIWLQGYMWQKDVNKYIATDIKEKARILAFPDWDRIYEEAAYAHIWRFAPSARR